MFRIGEFSLIAQVSGRLLRFYDEIGLLSPQYTDPQTGFITATTRGLLLDVVTHNQLGLAWVLTTYGVAAFTVVQLMVIAVLLNGTHRERQHAEGGGEAGARMPNWDSARRWRRVVAGDAAWEGRGDFCGLRLVAPMIGHAEEA
jgi:hypothetical protein